MKYQQKDKRSETEGSAGNFIQLGSEMRPSKRTDRKRSQKHAGPTVVSYLTIELEIAFGTAMRILGNMTPSQLRELMPASDV